MHEGLRDVEGEIRALGVPPMVPGDMALFLFGSSLHTPGPGSDIDLLLLYRDGEVAQAHRVAQDIRSASLDGRLDVLAMSHSEAAETAFIANEGAILLRWGHAEPRPA